MSHETAYKCDRCGCASLSVASGLPEKWVSVSIYGHETKDLDLCGACRLDLRTWLYGGKPASETPK